MKDETKLKLKNGIFNVVVYSMLGWSIISAVYMALPIEYQEMLPQISWVTALISGSSTALVGSGGLAVKSFLNRAKIKSDEKYNMLGDKFLTLVDSYNAINKSYNELTNQVDKNNLLLKVLLETKLSNPLIEETAKNLIEGVLNEEEPL